MLPQILDEGWEDGLELLPRDRHRDGVLVKTDDCVSALRAPVELAEVQRRPVQAAGGDEAKNGGREERRVSSPLCVARKHCWLSIIRRVPAAAPVLARLKWGPRKHQPRDGVSTSHIETFAQPHSARTSDCNSVCGARQEDGVVRRATGGTAEAIAAGCDGVQRAVPLLRREMVGCTLLFFRLCSDCEC